MNNLKEAKLILQLVLMKTIWMLWIGYQLGGDRKSERDTVKRNYDEKYISVIAQRPIAGILPIETDEKIQFL